MSVLHVAGIAGVVYGFLGPADKKSLSLTCKAMRRVYMETCFPTTGPALAPMRLSVDASWGGGGEAGLRRKCMAEGCARRTSPTANILGMKMAARIGMLTHCGRPECRDDVVKKSYDRALVALVADGGSATYLSSPAYYSLVEKCLAVSRAGLAYSRVRTAHDMLVSAMIRHAMSGGVTADVPHPPGLALEASVVTAESLCKSSAPHAKTIFVSF